VIDPVLMSIGPEVMGFNHGERIKKGEGPRNIVYVLACSYQEKEQTG